jgi:hypothetical protein
MVSKRLEEFFIKVGRSRKRWQLLLACAGASGTLLTHFFLKRFDPTHLGGTLAYIFSRIADHVTTRAFLDKGGELKRKGINLSPIEANSLLRGEYESGEDFMRKNFGKIAVMDSICLLLTPILHAGYGFAAAYSIAAINNYVQKRSMEREVEEELEDLLANGL